MRLGSEINISEVMDQVTSEEYDTFEDILDIVTEYGYLVLFAECFPAAPLILLVSYNFEMRSDMFKLSTVFRRPHFIRKRNLGSWELILNILSILSVFTNILFSISYSDNIITSGDENKLNKLLLFFLTEHFVLIITALVRISISSKSSWVKLFLERKEYKLKNKEVNWAKKLVTMRSTRSMSDQ